MPLSNHPKSNTHNNHHNQSKSQLRNTGSVRFIAVFVMKNGTGHTGLLQTMMHLALVAVCIAEFKAVIIVDADWVVRTTTSLFLGGVGVLVSECDGMGACPEIDGWLGDGMGAVVVVVVVEGHRGEIILLEN